MREEMIEMLAGILEMDADALSDRLDDCDVWDSLKKVEVLFAVEDEYDLMFESEEIGDMKTPEDLLQLIQSKM